MTKEQRDNLDARIESAEILLKWFAGNGYDKGKDSTGFQIVEIGKLEIPPVNPLFRDTTQHFFRLALRAIPYRGVQTTDPRKLMYKYEASPSTIEHNRMAFAANVSNERKLVTL